jgi:hypothetical protein
VNSPASWKRLWAAAAAAVTLWVSESCKNPPAPAPDLSVQINLDTTGTVVNADSLRAQLNKYVGKTVHFSRRGKCNGCVVDVTLKRIGKTYDIKALDGPVTPRQIALLHNSDAADTTEMYNMAPRHDYVLQIGRDSVTHASTYAVIELPLTPTGPLHVVASGTVTGCHPGHASIFSKVSFAYCTDDAINPAFEGSAMMSELGTIRSAIATVRRFFARARTETLERRGWFSCDSGCCTA